MSGTETTRPRWPLFLATFVSGLAIAFLAVGRSTPDGDAAPTPSAPIDVRASDPAQGPSSVREGVPVGFAHTEDGAVAAAASFVCTGQALLDMDPLSAEQAVRELAAAASADELADRHLEQLVAAREVLAPGTGPVTFRQSAIAWRVEAFDPQRARVMIWNVAVLSRDGVAPPQSSWSTSVVDLVWERDDWRVWGETVSPGPTPIADDSDAPATSQELTRSLDGFTDFGAVA